MNFFLKKNGSAFSIKKNNPNIFSITTKIVGLFGVISTKEKSH